MNQVNVQKLYINVDNALDAEARAVAYSLSGGKLQVGDRLTRGLDKTGKPLHSEEWIIASRSAKFVNVIPDWEYEAYKAGRNSGGSSFRRLSILPQWNAGPEIVHDLYGHKSPMRRIG